MANLVSFEPWDISTVNLYWYDEYLTGSSLQTTGFTFDGGSYPDLFRVQASSGGDTLELDFLGSGITQDAAGNVISGTVNAIREFDVSTNTVLWYADGFSISAPSIYDAALTPSNQDEINLIHIALSGNDTITGGVFNDVITGFSGSDVLTGGGGNNIFLDTEADHNGDTITDFHPGDSIVFTDASLTNFAFSVSGNILSYTGGSMTLESSSPGTLVASAAAQGGVQLLFVPLKHPADNDFNGDGRSDVLWRNDNGTLTEWLGTSNGSFTDNSAHALTAGPGASWVVAGTGDFNGDGRVDVLFRNTTTGAVTDWLGNADGSFTDNSAHALSGTADIGWQIVGTGDFNGDGISDVLWRNSSSGYLTEWLGTSSGGFTDNSAHAATGTADNSWHVVATGDFNGDGNTDILWRNATGYLTEWLGTSSGGFTDNASHAATGAADSSWQIVGTGDFNGDGISDILWRNSGGYTTEWLGTSSGGFTDNAVSAATGAADNTWHVVSIGDFNGDGKSDVLWRNDSGYTTEWLGTSSGGFTDNAAHAATGAADTSWHVQDPFS